MSKRARSLWALVGVLAVAGVAAESSFAHLPDARMCSSKEPAKVELKCGQRAYYHGLGVVSWIRENGTRTLASGKRVVAPQFQNMQRDHAWLMQAGRRWIVEARQRLAPKPTTFSVGHWALWSCITNGAYPGAAHEGNGYNGAFAGRLGMTTPWAGHMPTGGDWVHTPIATVYGYAEQEFARHGYSISWLYGQWPNTSPPCVARGLA